jgi:transcriptional regulator with XRE-family HTH domain
MEIGDKLRHFRTKKGISQETLAHLLGVERNSYIKMESGKTNVSWERLEQIVKILEVDIWELLTHDEKQVVYVHTNNHGHITNNGYITQQANKNEELSEKCKTLEIKIAVLEEKLCGKDKEIALLQKMVEVKKE